MISIRRDMGSQIFSRHIYIYMKIKDLYKMPFQGFIDLCLAISRKFLPICGYAINLLHKW